jgi:hypothetical protein
VTDNASAEVEAGGFYAELAGEFLHHYRRGPRFIAVTGVPRSDPARVADSLAAALRDAGQRTHRISVDGATGADTFREQTVAPFRSEDGVLIADGPELLNSDFRGFWNFSVWIERDPERSPEWSFISTDDHDELGSARGAASVLMDDVDFERPRRLWADSC